MSGDKALSDIDELSTQARRRGKRLKVLWAESFRQRMRGEVAPSLFPWQRAEEAARIARQVWSLGPGPVSTDTLSDLFCVGKKFINHAGDYCGSMAAGFRNGDSDFKVFQDSPHPTSRRFALMRLVGDHLQSPESERLLPAVNAKTHRQKFQRAFAQEFLCPYSELADYFGSPESRMRKRLKTPGIISTYRRE